MANVEWEVVFSDDSFGKLFCQIGKRFKRLSV